MVRGSTTLAVLFSAAALTACGSAGSTPSSPPDPACMEVLPTRGTPIDGALEIGTGSTDDFREYADGDSAAIVRGSQGGYMAIPVFRVDSTLLGADGSCAYLNVIATVDSLEPASFKIKLPAPSAGETVWFFGSLPLFLSSDESDLVNRTVTYNAAFLDDGKEADAQVSLLLVASQ